MFVALLSGCSVYRLPSSSDYEKIRSGERAMVFVRITGDINDVPYEIFGSSLADENIGLALGGFETGGEVRQILPVFLSAQTQKEGWIYVLLEPGLHYLAVLPPRRTNVKSYALMFEDAPLWRLDIPAETKLVYAGTLHLPCVEQKLLFGAKTISSIVVDKSTIRNDEQAARRIAAEFFPEFGTPKTMLMQRHKGPIILRTPSRHSNN